MNAVSLGRDTFSSLGVNIISSNGLDVVNESGVTPTFSCRPQTKYIYAFVELENRKLAP